MAQQGKIVGPADKEEKKKQDEELVESVQVVGGEGELSLTSFRPVTTETVRHAHPFEGYAHPMGKVKVVAKDHEGTVIGEQRVHAAYVVAYTPPVPQDPSGRNYIVTEDYKMDEVLQFGPYEGKKVEEVRKLDEEYFRNLVKTGKQRHAPLTTSHNRALRDWQEMRNYDVVFDRVAVLKDGEMPNVAVVANHNLRAQLVFRLDERTGAIKSDNRYAILDHNQRSRLLNTFKMLVAPQLNNIRLQQLVTGEVPYTEGQTPIPNVSGGEGV